MVTIISQNKQIFWGYSHKFYFIIAQLGGVGFLDNLPVEINFTPADFNGISGNSDDSFDKKIGSPGFRVLIFVIN